MRIEWHPNPLKTAVFLEPQDIEIVRLKLHIDHLEEKLIDGLISLEEGDPDKALAEIQYTDEGVSQHIDGRLALLIKDLETGTHGGDCTKMPASCCKCWAEDFAGFHTTEGISSGARGYLLWAFNKCSSAREVIQKLRQESSVECLEAADWLEKYTKEHFPHDLPLEDDLDDQPADFHDQSWRDLTESDIEVIRHG